MNYKKIYEDLCSSRENLPLKRQQGYELHHVVPKCLGGSDCASNMVKLTYREHFIAHRLLTKIYPHKGGLVTPLFFFKGNGVGTSRTFEYLRGLSHKLSIFNSHYRWSRLSPDKIKISRLLSDNVPIKLPAKDFKKVRMLLRLEDNENNKRVINALIIAATMREYNYAGFSNLKSGLWDNFYKTIKMMRVNSYLKREGFLNEQSLFTDKVSILSDIINHDECLKSIIACSVNTRGREFSFKCLLVSNKIIKWNKSNPDKMLTLVQVGSKFILGTLCHFLPADFKYPLYMYQLTKLKDVEVAVNHILELEL